jgi:glycyl-tRNA synthetase
MVFKKDARAVSTALDALAEDWKDFEPIATALEKDGKATVDGFEITKDMVEYSKTMKKVHEIKFTPSVIEPSFGMGRILYSLLEHSFYQRDMDEQRCVMRFNPQIAPQKCAVLPISSNPDCNAVVRRTGWNCFVLKTNSHLISYPFAGGRDCCRADGK